MTLDDLRPSIEDRPAGSWRCGWSPIFPGKAPPSCPPPLEPLRDVTVTA